METECADSLLFDKVAQRCDTEDKVDCSYANPCENEDEGSFIPGFRCNEYFICYQKKSWIQYCIDGFEFDPETSNCVESELGCPVSSNALKARV